MASKTQEQLLEEFGGLFDGEATGVDAYASGDGHEAQSLTEAADQLGQAASGMTVNPPASASSPPAGAEAETESSATMNGAILQQSGGLFSGGTTGSDASAVSDPAQGLVQTMTELAQMAAGTTADPAASVAATPAGTDTRGGASTPAGNGGSGTSEGSIATTFLESGFGIVPLITGLIGLFSGGSDAPPALEHYTMPSSLSFESADNGNGLTAADFDQSGAPRAYSGSGDSSSAPENNGSTPQPGAPAAGSGSASPQITVNVQAMDAQSFMDYSSQIAQAVRGAMLNLSSLNDVVTEL